MTKTAEHKGEEHPKDVTHTEELVLTPLMTIPPEWVAKIQRTNALLTELEAVWAGGTALSADDRKHSAGKSAARYVRPAGVMAFVLSPSGPGTAAARTVVHEEMDSTVGSVDGGTNPDVFEPAAVAGQLSVSAQVQVLGERLDRLTHTISDSGLSLGNLAVERYLLSLGELKQIVRRHPETKDLGKAVFDEMGKMTQAARAAAIAKDMASEPPATPTTPALR